MTGPGRTVLGAALGAALGLVIPILLAVVYLVLGGDAQGAGAFSFLPIVLIPLGLFLGGMTGSAWSPDRTLAGNLLAGLWRAIRPRWL